MTNKIEQIQKSGKPCVVRFAGDSGDGIQLQGQQFTLAQVINGYYIATLPDFPAEIRAPAGSRFGVSAFQIQFGGTRVTTPGDSPDMLVALNPASLAVNLAALKRGSRIIVDRENFTAKWLTRAGFQENPLTDGSLSGFEIIAVDMSSMTRLAVAEYGLRFKVALICRNFWALGLVMWLLEQSPNSLIDSINAKFSNANQQLFQANVVALKAGHAYGETAELAQHSGSYGEEGMPLPAGEYRTITGSESLALGLLVACELANLQMLFCSYPITPASSVLHHLEKIACSEVATFQAEDEIAAIGAAIGASYAGKLGVTSTSGPGLALKTEALGLAVATELPLLVIDSQRAGPSTGMPTKTEQSDLYQAVFGRNADAPVPVIAARSPTDCFAMAIEAVRIAVRHMTPVILLTDGYNANASEIWRIPDLDAYADIIINRPGQACTATNVFDRDPETLGRNWVWPSEPQFIHRVGGLEKDWFTGNISYEPENHQKMTDMRVAKVAAVAKYLPEQRLQQGNPRGLVVVGWGSTYGAIYEAVGKCLAEGLPVAQIHLNFLHPMPTNMGQLLACFEQVLVPELNTGQLATILRSSFLLEVNKFNKVTGQPLQANEVIKSIKLLLTHVDENNKDA